jgi:hypothetical protein
LPRARAASQHVALAHALLSLVRNVWGHVCDRDRRHPHAPDLHHGKDTRLMILVEAKFYPFLLMSVRGRGHSEAEYRAMFDATDAVGRTALREGTRYVCISVSSGTMSAAERKYVANRIAASPKELKDVSLATFVIVESQAFRGVLTALRWLAPALVNVDPVASVDAAMSAAAAAFERQGIQVDGALTRGARHWLQEQAALQGHASTTPS